MKTWTLGSIHTCPVDAGEHHARVECIDYAIKHRDREYAGLPEKAFESEPDLVNHPPHYTSHPSGVECIQVTEHLNFCIGNAIKYLWRADDKGDALENLRKARWYVDREIARREASS